MNNRFLQVVDAAPAARYVSLRSAALAPIATLLLLLQPAPADAMFIYSFETTETFFGFPPLDGSFSVADGAIADGALQTAEVESYLFTHGIFVYGDEPGDLIVIGSFDVGGLRVDPLSGLLTGRGDVSLLDASFAGPPTQHEARLQVDIGLPPGQNFFFDPGDDPGFGTWTCTHDGAPCATPVPAPSSASLLAAGGLVGLLGGFVRRRRATMSRAA